jgi:hypothetical protein
MIESETSTQTPHCSRVRWVVFRIRFRRSISVAMKVATSAPPRP